MTDIADFVRRSILSTPGLAIDGVMKSIGRLPSVEQIETWIGKS